MKPGRKKERDLVTAPVIRPPPGKVISKGNLPKSKITTLEAKARKGQTRSKVEVPNFSSDEVKQEMSAVDEEDFPQEYEHLQDESGDEEETEYTWKCKLLEMIQQYPEVYNKASPRYKKKT